MTSLRLSKYEGEGCRAEAPSAQAGRFDGVSAGFGPASQPSCKLERQA